VSIRKCEKCGGLARVIDSRERPIGFSRRRKCSNCGHRFSTVEVRTDQFKTIAKLWLSLKEVMK